MSIESLQPLIFELEQIWKETNELKNNLNNICDTSWSILRPPGHDPYGAFKIEEKSVEDQPSEHSASSVPVSEHLLRDVSDLISYGKQVLTLSQAAAQPKPTKKSQHSNTTHLTQTTKQKCSSKEICTNKMKKLVVNPQLSQQMRSKTKLSGTSCASQLSHQSSVLHPHKTVSFRENVETKEVRSTDTAKSDEIRYSHKCSLTLSDTLKTLKMPKGLRHLLKQYYHYQEKKSKPASLEHLKITHNFEDRLCKLARAGLEYNMSANPKLPDRYKKYVEIAADQETKSNKTVLTGETTSDSKRGNIGTVHTLLLQEEKHQHLMELQLQQRLLNVLLTSLE